MAKAKGILARQRPRRKKRPRTRQVVTFAVTLCIFAGAIGWVYFRTSKTYSATKRQPWKVDFSLLDAETMGSPGDFAGQIQNAAKTVLRDGSPGNLKQFAEKIADIGAFSNITVKRVGVREVAVAFKRHRPFAAVQLATKTYTLTTVGAIVANSPDPSQLESQVAVDFGDAIDSSDLSNGEVALNAQQLEDTVEAIALIRANDLHGVKLRRASFDLGTGWTLLTESDTEVLVGRKPFKPKLLKMREILKGENATKISRIELNYRNKAFIKERKI
jgi:cell division septal protein FtsQ